MQNIEGERIRLIVNGSEYDLLIKPWATLLEVLREDLSLTGTKEGCGVGECGACTVMMDGEPVNACLVLAMEANGKQITTIEGLAEGGDLHPLQRSFVENGGLQCGFCTPGMILTAKAILDEEEHPTEEVIKRKMAGNLCRCTGYKKIFEAVMSVTEQSGKEV